MVAIADLQKRCIEALRAADEHMTAAKRRANRGALPEHLPRIETLMTLRTRPAPAAQGPCT